MPAVGSFGGTALGGTTGGTASGSFGGMTVGGTAGGMASGSFGGTMVGVTTGGTTVAAPGLMPDGGTARPPAPAAAAPAGALALHTPGVAHVLHACVPANGRTLSAGRASETTLPLLLLIHSVGRQPDNPALSYRELHTPSTHSNSSTESDDTLLAAV